jgi:hypothetical protein
MKNFSFIILILLFSACKKDIEVKPLEIDVADTTGFLEIHLSNVIGNIPLVLNSINYVSSANDTFNVYEYKYYLSNIQLIAANGHTFTEVESYYLIDQSDPNSMHLMVKKVPSDQYNMIKFIIGVDHDRNIAGAQTGALDPIHGMFWDWNTGYIMAKMEGYSPQSTEFSKKLVYHIGGHFGKNNGIRSVELTFPNSANCTINHTPVLNMKADLGTWFSSPNFSNFATLNVSTGISNESSGIADNYANMFSVTSVVN